MVTRGKNKEISKDNLIIDWSDINILEFPNKSRYGKVRSLKSVGQYGEAKSLKSIPEVLQP
jgi:hypothetical protein